MIGPFARPAAIVLVLSLCAPAHLFAGLESARSMAESWPSEAMSDFSPEALSHTAGRPWVAGRRRHRHDRLEPSEPQKHEIEVTYREDLPVAPWTKKDLKTIGLAILVGAAIGLGAGGAGGAGFGAVFGMLFGVFWALFSRLK